MYKLYLDKGIRKVIDISENEQDIIDTMGEYLKSDNDLWFLVKERVNGGDNIKGFIRGYEDYIKYVECYNERLKKLSCIELKQDIVKNQKIKRLTK